MMIEDVIKKSILPLAFILFWFLDRIHYHESQWKDRLVLVDISFRTSIWNT